MAAAAAAAVGIAEAAMVVVVVEAATRSAPILIRRNALILNRSKLHPGPVWNSFKYRFFLLHPAGPLNIDDGASPKGLPLP
ncbi:hypothetical protein [Bradyrhizobium sp. DOA1]|uniref:hypothetical protein n=1 Tax=Bradyrhizobium sp. DOA1 TaxID=1126616 RepID=UPI0012E97E36|nr:hypothetical protein [Bradyrhizobium sp. DOA1]